VAKADADAEVVATARVLAPGPAFYGGSIARVCTSPAHRRRDSARALMDFSIRSAPAIIIPARPSAYPRKPI
jgi:predicted GNAT family N-acyltransferase